MRCIPSLDELDGWLCVCAGRWRGGGTRASAWSSQSPSGSRNGPDSNVTTMLIRVSGNGKVEEGRDERGLSRIIPARLASLVLALSSPAQFTTPSNSPPIAFRFPLAYLRGGLDPILLLD
jgi:hypothetical protein